MLHRRMFLAAGVGSLVGGAVCSVPCSNPGIFGARIAADEQPDSKLPEAVSGEGLCEYILRVRGRWDDEFYRRLLGAANEFKEGDEIIGVATRDPEVRLLARTLLAETTLWDIDRHPPFSDELYRFISNAVDRPMREQLRNLTLSQLKERLLNDDEVRIHEMKSGLSSDVIACVVRLMDNEQLIRVGSRIFNPLPGSNIGARGYMGARVQPNSPTDNVDDIRWQVFDAFAYAVGDVLLGTNPVSSTTESVTAVQQTLQDIVATFDLTDTLPHCVLSHIDVQAEVERRSPGLTALWFQSIAGNDAANQTFDISVKSMTEHAQSRTGRFGLYFETGQGADFSNGHGHQTDMVVHESRKYGFARALTAVVGERLRARGSSHLPWVHLNDVAGFIGPEVFRSREQLVRCCLEDIVMGKLHGLTIGLDICSTLHMDVTLQDLGWCIDQIMPANPGYLMALPTRVDPMLGYLTTGYHDHVHIREKFGFRVNDRMWEFFRQIGVINDQGHPTEHFGDPKWVYLQYCRRKNDLRTDEVIRAEATRQIAEVRERGVFIAEGYGDKHSRLPAELSSQIQSICEAARIAIWKVLPDDFAERIPNSLSLQTRSADREDYILHPQTGEQLSEASRRLIDDHRRRNQAWDTQLVLSDGLNALSLLEGRQLEVLLRELRRQLAIAGFRVDPVTMIVNSGRVRAGYRIGEQLFGGRNGDCRLLHVIGERPGSGHQTMSVYMTGASGQQWGTPGLVDHNITQVVSGIAATALSPELAARQAVDILKQS